MSHCPTVEEAVRLWKHGRPSSWIAIATKPYNIGSAATLRHYLVFAPKQARKLAVESVAHNAHTPHATPTDFKGCFSAARPCLKRYEGPKHESQKLLSARKALPWFSPPHTIVHKALASQRLSSGASSQGPETPSPKTYELSCSLLLRSFALSYPQKKR